jgi:hypothetical protein
MCHISLSNQAIDITLLSFDISSVEFIDWRNELLLLRVLARDEFLPFHPYGGNEQTLVDGKEMYIDTFNRVPFSIPIALVGRAVVGLGAPANMTMLLPLTSHHTN